jgi:hypothetical protein
MSELDDLLSILVLYSVTKKEKLGQHTPRLGSGRRAAQVQVNTTDTRGSCMCRYRQMALDPLLTLPSPS